MSANKDHLIKGTEKRSVNFINGLLVFVERWFYGEGVFLQSKIHGVKNSWTTKQLPLQYCWSFLVGFPCTNLTLKFKHLKSKLFANVTQPRLCSTHSF